MAIHVPRTWSFSSEVPLAAGTEYLPNATQLLLLQSHHTTQPVAEPAILLQTATAQEEHF